MHQLKFHGDLLQSSFYCVAFIISVPSLRFCWPRNVSPTLSHLPSDQWVFFYDLSSNLTWAFSEVKATSRRTYPLQTRDSTFLFNLGGTGSSLVFQCPQDTHGLFRLRKTLLFVLALATTPKYKARLGMRQGEHLCVQMRIRSQGVLSVRTGRKQNPSWQRSDCLRCPQQGVCFCLFPWRSTWWQKILLYLVIRRSSCLIIKCRRCEHEWDRLP